MSQNKPQVQLPFPLPTQQDQEDSTIHNHVRPKPQRYSDRTWAPPRGTRRSMGKR
ncbi:hypothetical protein [Acinetobacter sp. ANC 5502]